MVVRRGTGKPSKTGPKNNDQTPLQSIWAFLDMKTNLKRCLVMIEVGKVYTPIVCVLFVSPKVVRDQNGTAITFSLCRDCHTTYMERKTDYHLSTSESEVSDQKAVKLHV